MSPPKYKGSPPLLLRQGSVENSLYGISGLSEKDFDPDVLLESPSRSVPTSHNRLGVRMSTLFGWPAIVILGQSLLQLLGWGFFLGVKVRGQVPLPFGAALWVKNNPHVVTLVATLIATILAGCSSFLFSYAIRRSMTLYLNRPVSLATLGASVSISTRSVVFHRRSWKWPAVSFLFFALAGIQTSGWTTLLTPVTLVISTPLAGSELDLSNPILRQMADTGWELDFCTYDQGLTEGVSTSKRGGKRNITRRWSAGETDSGYITAKARLGQPSTFTLMDQVFNVSTGGVLPAYLTSVDASTWFADASIIPVSTHNVSRKQPATGFATNYSMTQQGFTANVSCTFKNLTKHTTPSMIQMHKKVGASGTNDVWGYDGLMQQSMISSTCDDSTFSGLNYSFALTLLNPDSNWVQAISCGPTDNYTLGIVTHGSYDWIPMTVCSVTPQVTTVHADYTPGINITIDPNQATATDPRGPAVVSAIATFLEMIYYSQGIESNLIGDQLTAILADSQDSPEDILGSIEEYIRGVVEYSGSLFRACLTSNATFMEKVAPRMSIPTNGTFRTETLGWSYTSGTTRWVLVPGTLIAFATIAVVVGALYRHPGDISAESNQFDPSDPLHLMAAAAAGGLNNAFRGLDAKDLKEGEKFDVVLGSIPGRGPALVRADQYKPVLWDSFSPRSAHEDRGRYM